MLLWWWICCVRCGNALVVDISCSWLLICRSCGKVVFVSVYDSFAVDMPLLFVLWKYCCFEYVVVGCGYAAVVDMLLSTSSMGNV